MKKTTSSVIKTNSTALLPKKLATNILNGTRSSPSSTQMKITTTSVIKTNSKSLLPKKLATNSLKTFHTTNLIETNS
jgi:hypothetical protein